jgi:O-antigen/teichoic acid export membrane protein
MKILKTISWALFDQGLVSGANFLVGVLLARSLGPAAFGQFILAHTILMYATNIQSSLVCSPMMSLAPQLEPQERATYLQGALGVQLVLGLMLSLLAFAFGYVWSPALAALGLDRSHGYLALGVFCFLAQDWMRRYLFTISAHLNVVAADTVTYLGQIGVLLALWHWQALSVYTALLGISACMLAGFLIGVLPQRLIPDLRQLPNAAQHCAKVGGHLLMAGQLQWAGSQGVLLIGAGALGTHALGGIRAVINLVGPLMLVFQALENVVPVRAAQHYANSNLKALTSFLVRLSFFGGGLLALLCVVLVVFAPGLMSLVYGPAFEPYAHLVAWQASFCMLGFFYRQAIHFHRTVGETSVILAATALSAVVGLGVTALTIRHFHEVGVMLGLVTGQAAGLFLMFWATHQFLKRTSHVQAHP